VLVDPALPLVRVEEVRCGLLGEVAVGRRLGLDPLKLRLGLVAPADGGVVQAQEAREQEPEAAAVVDVLRVPVDAACNDETPLDRLDHRPELLTSRVDQAERDAAGEETRVESVAEPRTAKRPSLLCPLVPSLRA
jgi:hypothetical protein